MVAEARRQLVSPSCRASDQLTRPTLSLTIRPDPVFPPAGPWFPAFDLDHEPKFVSLRAYPMAYLFLSAGRKHGPEAEKLIGSGFSFAGRFLPASRPWTFRLIPRFD